jgi:hypothetical protein
MPDASRGLEAQRTSTVRVHHSYGCSRLPRQSVTADGREAQRLAPLSDAGSRAHTRIHVHASARGRAWARARARGRAAAGSAVRATAASNKCRTDAANRQRAGAVTGRAAACKRATKEL